jgi:adenine specific DNA methylase Mod
MNYEQQFLDALKSIFVGAKVEGESGYINQMKIKASYFEKGVFPQLMKDIDAACKPFPGGFREELFDKLYDFFRHYFSESGSIYFRNTAQHHNIYEKVYTDDRDVMLFWKTHMLYYVKTDRLFNSMDVEVDGEKFFFDVSGMELKRANEKRELTYTFKSYRDGKTTLTVGYSEKGRKTKVDDILKAVKAKGVTLAEETLEKAFRVFEKQSEVDYFINKNARAFLCEQFDLWMYQYLFKGESEFREERLRQLQAIKDIAYKIIEFIAQFEDELVRVWNKPKFVLNSHYIVTLDKILAQPAGPGSPAERRTTRARGGSPNAPLPNPLLLERIFKHKGMKDQIAEWQELGMLPAPAGPGSPAEHRGGKGAPAPTPARLLEMVLEKDLVGEPLYPQYQYLPLDTKYFKDLELDILALFDDLDASLDGWLIHSENYQALQTLLPKFREQVKAIYIDPPYNTDAGPIDYANNYRNASWLSLLENRLSLSRLLLSETGIICVTIDDYQIHELGKLLDNLYGRENQLGVVVIRNNPSGRSTVKGISVSHEYAFFFQKTDAASLARLPRTEKQLERFSIEDGERVNWQNFRKGGGAVTYRTERPKQYYPVYVNAEKKTIRVPALSWNTKNREWDVLEQPNPDEVVLLPIDEKGKERVWSLNHYSAVENIKDLEVRTQRDGSIQIFRKHIPSEGVLPRSWWDKNTYAAREYGSATLKNLFGESSAFSFAKSPYAVQDCLWIAGLDDDADNLAVDFFAGSGTTAHAVMNLNREDSGERKYLLIEIGEHFNTVILPRVKKVAFSDTWKDGKALVSSDGLANPSGGKGISHFAKYFELEQYEDTLRKARYEDSPLFAGTQDAYTSYVFLRDLKLLEAVKVDKKKNKVEVSLEKLYDGIDLAETLSCLTGKWIKRISEDTVEFQDGTIASLSDPRWEDLKPLIWW